jgi:hypothetical protein
VFSLSGCKTYFALNYEREVYTRELCSQRCAAEPNNNNNDNSCQIVIKPAKKGLCFSNLGVRKNGRPEVNAPCQIALAPV